MLTAATVARSSASARAGRLYLGRDALQAELGRLESRRDDTQRLIAKLTGDQRP